MYHHFSSLLTLSTTQLHCVRQERPRNPCFLDHPIVTAGKENVVHMLGPGRESQCVQKLDA